MPRTSDSDLERVEEPAPLPARPADGNKGTFGRVLIVGGSDEMIGAPVLAGMAALRIGAGLVEGAMPEAGLAGGVLGFSGVVGGGVAGGGGDRAAGGGGGQGGRDGGGAGVGDGGGGEGAASRVGGDRQGDGDRRGCVESAIKA